jgi:hypothetical protein
LQLVKKFPAFHGTRMFITALTSVHFNCSLLADFVLCWSLFPTVWLVSSFHHCITVHVADANAKLSKSLSVCSFNTKRHEPQRNTYFFKLVVLCVVNTQKKYVNTEQKSITIDYLRAVKGPGITIANAFAQFCILSLGMFRLGYVYNSC